MIDYRARAKKIQQSLIEKHGSKEAYLEHMRTIAQKGGKKSSPTKGMASATPEQRKEWGRKGGNTAKRNRAERETGTKFEQIESDVYGRI